MSFKNKIDIKEFLIECNLNDSSPEPNNNSRNISKQIINEIKPKINNLETNTNKILIQVDKILNTSNNLYQINLEQNTGND